MDGAGIVTALQPYSGAENPDKGENAGARQGGTKFSPLSPFSGSGAVQGAIPGMAAVVLAAVRAYPQPGSSRTTTGISPPSQAGLPARAGRTHAGARPH